MRKTLYLPAVVPAILTVVLTVTPAWADPPPPTDGTETYEPGCTPIPEEQGGGELCWDETGYGPPTLIRVDVERCVVVVDPPQWVWLTAHIQQTDGTVATSVFPYEYDRPGEIDFDLTPHVDEDGQVSDVWFTWNIGSGESDHTGPIDCTPEPTPTTTPPIPPEAPHHICPLPGGGTVKTGLETSCPTVPVDIDTPATAAPTLPETGTDSLLVWIGLGALAGGIAALILGRKR